MKKIHVIAALLAMLMPTVLLAGGSSTTYYAALKAQVSGNCSGMGKVYAGTSNSAPAASNYKTDSSTSSNQSSTTKDESKNFYAFASANEGYEFSHWSTSNGGTSVSKANPYTVGVKCSSSTESSPTLTTVYAVFKKKTLAAFDITFATSDAGTYTVDGSAPANKTGLTEATTVILKSTDPNFLSWNVGGTTVSDNPYTATCIAATTISANFLTADQVTTVTTYDELVAALANAQYVKITIPSGKEITVAKGATLTVPSGKQLVVDGTLWVEGTLAATGSVVANGKVSKCLKEITQTGDNGQPLNPYGSVKYWKTSSSSSSASITGFTGFKTHATIVGGFGTQYRPEITSSSKLIIAVPDSTVAVNHIKSIGSVSTSVNVVNDTLNSGMVILLGSDCVINGGLTAKTGFRGVVDCAGFTCKTITSQEVSGNNGKATFLNCPSFTGSKVINITHDYFNCDRVTLSSFNAGGSPILNFYDCGTFSSPASFSASYSKGPTDTSKFNFYSGYYNSLTYKSCFKVYGGSYKSDPATYIADQDNFEAAYDSSSKYYVVQEKTEVLNVAAINGTEYETLSAAIAAAGNGATISLIEGVDLTGTTVEVPSSKNITIALDKHTITGGKIVNRGTLLITDITVANESNVKCDIENYGTLDLVFGTYTGAIANKAGTLTTHNGVFTGTLAKDGGTVNLKGGHFTADVTAFVTAEGYDVFKDTDNRFCVCELPNGTMYDTTVSSTAGYGATPYNDADFSVLYSRVKDNKTGRSDYSDANWKRLAQLLNFYQIFSNRGLDATIVFDRDVAKNSINLYAKSTASMPVDFKYDLPAGQLYRALSEVVVFTYGYYAKTYYSIFDENIKSVAMAVSDKSGNNNGTVCKAMIELWKDDRASDYSSTGHKITNTVYVAGQKLFTLGAGSNAAMIRPATGAATFYANLSLAMDAAADGGTVMLANDCDAAFPLSKAGTYTFDTMGFAHSDEVSVGNGLFVKSTSTVDSAAKVLLPDAVATTYVVATKVAQVGGTFYDNLTEAVGAANGAVVTLLAATGETITLTAEGQSIQLTVADGVSFNDSQITTSATGCSVDKTVSGNVATYTAMKKVAESAGASYPSVTAAVEAAGNDEIAIIAITVTANVTENVTLPQGKALTVTVNDGVEANITVTPADGSFMVTTTNDGSTTYEAKKITVEMEEPQAAAVEVTKIENGTETTVSDSSAINAAIAKLTGNTNVPRTDNTDNLDVLEKIEVTPQKIVLEENGTTIKSATFDVVPTLKAGQSLGAGQRFRFRLPVDSAAAQLMAKVYHAGALFSIAPVSSANDVKFIEVESGDFSPYGYELVENMVQVSDGFYQNANTYGNSTDFYITNVNGLKFFRDLVNGETAASYAYFTATGVTGTYPTTPNGIKSFHSNNMFSGKTVHLLADLDLAGEQWVSIGFNRAERTITDPDTSASASVSKCTFYGLFDAGIYDGEGNLTGTHLISNLDTSWQYVPEAATLQEKYQLTGLFGQLSGGTTAGVKNLTVRNATVVGRTDVGVIAGRSYNGGAKIENCHVVGNVNVSGTGTYIGGLVGECRASIVNSSVDAAAGSSISGLAYVGGLAGSVFQYNANDSVEVSGSAVSNTTVSASYSGEAGVGALVGVTSPSGTYHGNVVITGNDANDVAVTAPNASASSGSVGTLVGYALYDNGSYAIVADNTVSGTTSATASGDAVTSKMGAVNDNIAVGENVTFDTDGKITGGIFEVINEEVIAEGYLSTDNLDTTTSASYPLTIGGPYYAQIGTTGYASLAAAVGAASDGDVITILAGGTFEEVVGQATQFTINKSVTIDFNGKTVTAIPNSGFNVEAGGTVLSNGTLRVVSGSSYVVRVNGAEDVVVDSLNTYGGVNANNSTVTLANNDIHSAMYYSICSQGGSVVTVNSGTYHRVDSDGGYEGAQLIYCPSGSSLKIKGGTFQNSNNFATWNWLINGAGNVAITGGTFYFDPTDHYGVRSAWVTDNGNGTWTVVAPDPVAMIGDTPYYSLEEAVADTDGWDPIVMLTDIDLGSDVLTLDKMVTLYGAEDGETPHTLTGTVKVSAAADPEEYVQVEIVNLVFGTGSTIDVSDRGDGNEVYFTLTDVTAEAPITVVAGDLDGRKTLIDDVGDLTATDFTATLTSGYELYLTFGALQAVKWVASVNGMKFEDLANAIDVADLLDANEITILDGTTVSPNADWKVVDGKLVRKVYVAQIVTNEGATTNKYETVEDALTAAQTAGATIEILANSTETPDHALEVLMGGDITLTSSVPVRVEIAPTAKTSSVDNDGMAYIRSVSADARCTFTVGANVTLAFPATAAGAGAMYVGYSSANAADVVVNGRLETYVPYVGSLSTLTVNPSGSIKSVSEDLIVRWGAAVNVIGTGADWSDSNPQAEFGYVELQGGVTRLKDTYAKGGAWVHLYNRNADKVDQYGATTLVLDNSVLATSKINNEAVIELDVDSQIVTPDVQNTGSINIDATGITQAAKVIDYTGSGTMALADYGTVNVTGGTAYVDGNDLWITMPPVAEAYDAEGGTLIGQFATVNEAIAAAGATYVKLLDNVTLTAPLTMTNSYTLDFNGKTIYYNTTATTVINGSSNIIFKNGKLDISSCAISSSTDQGLLIFKFNPDGNILTFDKVELYGKNCRTYGIFSFANSTNGSTVNFINGSRIAIENESNLDYSDIFKGLGSTYPYVVNITDSTVSCTNVTRFSLYGTVNVKDSTVTFTGGENAFRQGAFTFDNSTVTVSGAKAGEGKGLVPRFSDTIVTNGSALTFIGSNIGKDVLFEYANNIVIYDTSTVTAASVSGAAADRAIIAPANYVLVTTDNGGASVTYSVTPAVARIGDTYYATFAEAIAAAEAQTPEPVIIVLDTTAVPPADWKFVTDDSEPPVTTLVRRVYVAQVGTTKYENLADAIYAAYNGGTVTLLTDITVADWEQNVYSLQGATAGTAAGPNGLVIDGNGHSLTVSSLSQNSVNNGAYLLSKGSFTVKDLTVNLPAGATGFAPQGGSFENVTINGGKRAMNLQWTTDTVKIEGCTIANTSGSAFYTEGGTKVAVNDSIFDNSLLSINGTWSFTSNTVKNASADFGSTSVTFRDNDLSEATVGLWADNVDLSENYWGTAGDYESKVAANNRSYTVDSLYTAISKDESGSIQTLSNLAYKVKFVNFDGSTLFATNVVPGGVASYEGATPAKPGDETSAYAFSGWDPATIVAVTDAPQTYTAQFAAATAVAAVFELADGGATTNNYASYSDLHSALEAGKAAGKTVALLADIDLAGVAWTPVQDFGGIFDGNGKTIANLVVNTPDSDYAGLIGKTVGSNSSVKNVTIENATVTGRGMVGAIIGQVASSSTVSNLVVKGLVQVSGNYKVGGIAGWGYVYFRDSHIIGDAGSFVKATYLGTKAEVANNPENNDYEGDNVGGIIGHLGEGSGLGFYDCSVSGLTITGTRKIGGMVGTFSHSSQISNADVSNVTLGTTATLDYANGNKSTMHLGGIVGSYFGSAKTGTISGTVKDVTILTDGFAYGISFAAGNVNYGLVTGGSRAATDYNPENLLADWSGVIAKGYDAAKYSNDFLINNYVAVVTDAEGNFVGGYETVDVALSSVAASAKAGYTVNIFAGEYALTTKDYTLARDVKIVGETDADGKNLVTISGNPVFNSAKGLSVENVDFECEWESGGTSMTVYGNATFTNCGFKGRNAIYYSIVADSLAFTNCTMTGRVYGLNIGEGTGDVYVHDCTITGWTSFGNSGKTIVSSTTFEDGNYDYLRFYQDAIVSNCTFNSEMKVNVNSTEKSLIVTDSSVEGGASMASIVTEGEHDVAVSNNYIAVGSGVKADENFKVTGGVFEVVDDAIIAPGYISVPNMDSATAANYPLTIGGPYVAVIYDANGVFKNGYATLKAAFDAVNGYSEDSVVIQILQDVPTSDWTSDTDLEWTKNVVIDTPVTEGVTVNLDNLNLFVEDGKDMEIGAKVTISTVGQIGSYTGNNVVLNGAVNAVQFYAYRGSVNVTPSSKVTFHYDGQMGMWGGASINITGDLADALNANVASITPQLSGGYIKYFFGNDTVTLKDTYARVALITGDNRASATYHGNTFALALTNSILEITETTGLNLQDNVSTITLNASRIIANSGIVTIGDNDQVVMDWKSSIAAKNFTNTGKIVLDMAGFDGTFPLTLVSTTDAAAQLGDFKVINNTSGATLMLDANGNIVAVEAVAQIGDKQYGTLEAAIAAAQAGDTVTLLKDVAVNAQINLPVPLTIDLNGKTVTSAADNRVFKIVTAVGEYTFKNGTVNTTNPCYGLFRVDNASTVTVEGITTTNDRSWGCNFRVAGGAQVLVTNCTITATNGGGVYAEGGSTVNVYDSTIAETGTATDCNASAFAVGEGATITVHNGTYSGEYGAFVCSSGGTIEILDGSVTGRRYAIESDARAGGNEDNSIADSLIKISGGTIDGELHEEIQLYNSATLTYANKMQISGGTFLNYSATGPTADNAGYEISGGQFDHQVLAEHCADGYSPTTTPDANGMYTVISDFEAQIVRNGEVILPKGTLAEMIADAQEGDTVQLLKDVTLTAQQTVGNLTIDLNGHSVTTESSVMAFRFEGNSTLTDSVGTGSLNTRCIDNYGSLAIDGVTYNENGSGGASAIRNFGPSLAISNSTFTVNSQFGVTSRQGADDVTIYNSTIQPTAAQTALVAINSEGRTDTIIEDSTINAWFGYRAYRQGSDASPTATAEGSTVVVKGSVVDIDNSLTGDTNGSAAFATFVDDVTIAIENTAITVTTHDVENAAGSYAFGSHKFNNANACDGLTLTIDEDSAITLSGTHSTLLTAQPSEPNLLSGENVDFEVEGDTLRSQFEGAGYAMLGVPNKEGWYTVNVAVAQIGADKYATFAEAIVAAEAYKTANGDYPVITVLDATAEQTNPDWKIVDGKLVHKVYVAQIGTTKYESLASAVAAANAGDTIEMIADDRLSSELVIGRSVTITGAVDSEGKPLYTIYGKPTDNYNVDIFVKNASSAIDVTIQNVNISEFGHQYKTSTGNAALYVSRSTHADTHVLVSNVTFSAYNNYAIIAPQGHLEVVDCAIDGYKDSSYGTFATGGIWSGDMFDDLPSSTVSVVRTSIINTDSNMPGVTCYAIDARAGSTVTVTDCTITNVHDGIAAAASQESGDGEASVSVSGTTVTASRNALAITGNPQIAKTVLAYLEVTSGMFAGAVTIPDEFVEDGIIEISGGVFDRAVPEDYCATGYIPTANTDAATSAAYPYTVGAAVAQIVRGGNVVAKYESLVAAYNASESGDTIELLGDDRSLSADDNAELTITKSITITGPVDANGDPLYTIYGKNDSNGYNDIFIRAGASDTVTISNVNVAQFGNQASLVMDVAPIYVGGGNEAKVVLDNVHVSEFLRIGVMMSGSGEFEVRNCYIDGARERSDTCSYGIEVHRGAHGVIADTTIENVSSTSEGWGAACVTINGQGAVSITNCTFVGGVSCDGIGTSENATEGACTSVVTIEDSTIDADCAMGMNVDGAQFVVKSGTYSGYLGLKDGFANAAPYSISGGMFEYEVPEEFCASGFIPAANTDTETSAAYPYTVKEGAYVAQIGETKYETFAEAIAAADAAVAGGDPDPVIKVLDQTATQDNADWIFATDSSVEPPVTTLVRRTYYNVWVGGTRIAADNAADVFGDGKVSYDATTKTLTLNGYTYSGAGYENSAIYATEDIAIVVQGENSLTSTAGNCIYAGGTISVTGDGTTPTLNIAAKSNSYALQVAGASAAFTNVTMAVSGNRGFVVNENNDPSDSIDIKGCNITFANGTDRALQVWNGEGDSLLTIADSTVTGVGRIVMFAEGDTGDTTCFITNSTVALTDSQIESYNGDATVEISESTVSMTGGSNNKNGAFNVGARYGADTTASVKILNNSDVTCSGQYSGINVWTWGENGPQASEIIVEDSTLTSSGSYYGLSAYSIYEGETSVYFTNSTVNATGAISAIEMCSDSSYNAIGDKTYTQIDSAVTLTTTQYAYGLDLDNSTSGGVNGDASNTATITGGSLTCNGCGLYVVGDDDNNSGITMHDANVTIDVTGRDWYPIVTGELSIDSGSYTVIDPDENGIAVDVGNISGGNFNFEVPEELCADGYIPREGVIETINGVDYYTVKRGSYVAQIVRGGEVIAKYETFTNALEAAESGDTVQLLANVEDVTETFVLHSKNITIDGQGLYSITAGENTEPRSVVQSYGGARNMFVVQSGNVTFKDITLDGGETHYYTFLVQAKNGTTTFDNVSLLHGGEADSSGTAGVGYGAAVQVDGATVLVTNSFYACTGTNVNDVTTGVFPFTALLYQSGGIHFADGVTAGIGDDLLLVGMVGAVDVSTDAGREMVSEMLEAMNVPAGYYPYTLKLGDSEMTSFTGASPLGWNGIIDYGSDIMVAANTSMGMDLNPDTTPVEVGLLADTVLPETFIYEDGNLTVNGNGNALSGTIKYTDDAGTLENVVLGSEGNQLVLDMTGLSAGNSINLGTSIAASNVTIKVTEEQATTLGLAIVTWNTEGESEEAEASLETGIKVVVVNAAGEPVEDPVTGDPMDASIIWDAEMGVAYIGPCEARLTGPTHESPIYTSLASAIARATDTGDTITLLTNVVNVTTTYEISKQDLVIDGAGYTVAAAPVTEHRNMFEAWSGSKNMFKLQTGNITFRNITLDGDETHAYTFLISADNSSVALTTENVRLIHGGEISEDSNNATVTPGNGYGAAIHLNNGAHLIVSNGFYACTGTNVNGVTTGVFPFTAILPENLEAGTSVAFELTGNPNDPANVDIGDDLLLVGMIGDLIEQKGIDAFQEILNYMKVPSRFIPYTLTLADGSAYAFTGASPRRWNEIIDYGKDIMDVATANGFSGLDKDTTPVEVGLATDTVLPAGADGDGYDFLYEDSNFSINGNGNALSGTIKFTDDADGGLMHDIDLGTDDAPLMLDLSATTNAVMLGGDVVISNVVVKLTEDQATLGKVVFEWDSGETPPDDEQGVEVTVVNNSGTPTGDTKGLVWDEEYGVAYIGPVEARLTGSTHETPVYTSLANALDIAKDNDLVELLTNAVLSAVQGVGSDVTLDLEGYKVAVSGDQGLLVTNATLNIVDSGVSSTGMVYAADGAAPTSLIESGNGGVVNITNGVFVAASGQNVLVATGTGAFAVSGGYFSNPVLPEHCAESYTPVDAEAGAPQPYTVAEFVSGFVYPIDGSVGVPVTNTWLATYLSDIYSDPTKPVLASITNDLVQALSENGANEMPRWESYVLGLDPTDVTARLRLTATAKDAATVTITGVIDLTKFPKPEGTTITFRLAEVNPDGTKKEDLVTDSEEPLFDVLLEDVVGKELAIFADIAVEGVVK